MTPPADVAVIPRDIRFRHEHQPAGAALVHGALIAYGKYFDEPGWQPDAPAHER
jgi:hypothetical protein